MDPSPKKNRDMLRWAAAHLQRGGERLDRLAASRSASRAVPVLAERTYAHSFEHATQQALDTAVHTNQTVNVVAIKIDFFDVIIASHGLEVSRDVLQITARRIHEAVRTSDALCELEGGFGLLWSPTGIAPSISEVVARIAKRLDNPFATSIGQLTITASIGVASFTGVACKDIEARALLRQARSAALSAQRNGRAQVAYFDSEIQAQAVESYETEHNLRAALLNDDLSVDYQPIVNLHSGAVVGVEALARWRDAVRGPISPATFIPIAEESGLINQLGDQIMHVAMRQAGTWADKGVQGGTVMINLSNRQLLNRNLVPEIARVLEDYQLDAQQICFEISESVVMSDVAASMTILGHMKDLGLILAIDDFGTGYSSLSYLRHLPVDILKIDQSFVHSIYNRDDRVITKAIIDLAHTLGMTTIAEGVETELQVEVLHALNCDMAQGYLLHTPRPADDVCFEPIDFTDYTSAINGTHGSDSTDAVRRSELAHPSNGNPGSSFAPAASAVVDVRQ